MTKNNAVSIFDPANVPDHIKTFNEQESNIVARDAANTLTFKGGKAFTVSVGGNKTILMKKNDDGDEEPRSTIPVVILGYAPRRGRSYYEGGFNEASPSAPTCWSTDGIAPPDDVPAKQSLKCATCPMSVKGSKVTDAGVETKACQEHLMVAVQLYRKWDMPPLRLRLPITSVYDARNKENEAKGWYAYDQYTTMLKAHGVKHTASVVTRIKFDPLPAYPKLLFSSVGWLSEEELEIVGPLAKPEELEPLLNPVFTAAPETSKKPLPTEDTEEDGPKVASPKAGANVGKTSTKPSGKPKPAPAPVEDDDEGDGEDGEIVTEGGEEATDVTGIVAGTEDDDEEDADEKAAKKAAEVAARAATKAAEAAVKAAAEAKARKAAAKAAAAAADDDDQPIVVTPPKAPKTAAGTPPGGKTTTGKPPAPKGTPGAAPATVSAKVGKLIDNWDD